MKRSIVFLFIVLIPFLAQSQRWKKTRYEVIGAIGSSHFMGDLGGGADAAAHFMGLRDFDIQTTQPSFGIGMRYKLYEAVAIKGGFQYGIVSANDKYSANYDRMLRNLHFSSPIIETSAQLEFSIVKESNYSRFRRKRSKSLSNLGINVYLFAGIGGFYFNPKAEYAGKRYALQPLSTEGQGITDTINPTPSPYKRFQLCFPMGIGFKYNISKMSSIGLEIGNRYTTTDYIDDVSTYYYDNQKIRSYVSEKLGEDMGDIASKLADRHITPEGQVPISYPVQDRMPPRGGQSFNDAYVFIMVQYVKKLRTARNGLPKF